jgi:phosphoribosylformylglycinamidine synthase
VVGILDDVHRSVFPHFREAGRVVALLRATEPGDVTDAESEFGSSDYAKEILGAVWGYPPELDLEKEAALQKAIIEMIRTGLIESAHDCSEGGIAVALAEAAMPKAVGFKVDLPSSELPGEFVLFGEDASRIVISCAPDMLLRIQEAAVKYGLSLDTLGQTVPGQVEITIDGAVVVSSTVEELRQVYESALENALRSDAVATAS